MAIQDKMQSESESESRAAWARLVSETCTEWYQSQVPGKVKPSQAEWTVLSCVLQIHHDQGTPRVVAAGTGTRCIGQEHMEPKGIILNDSHAEVMARRGFLRYLYEQITSQITTGASDIFLRESSSFRLKDGVGFHLYTSQTPCGDASVTAARRDVDETKTRHSTKRRKLDPDSARVGESRCKPGRGDQTLSSSCSDKMARWLRVGLQGALLSRIIAEPVSLDTVTVGGGCTYSDAAMTRALFRRGGDDDDAMLPEKMPVLAQCDVPFLHCQAPGKNPSPLSVVWCRTKYKPLETAVNGRRLGTTKKNFNSLSSSLLISKFNLFSTFLDILRLLDPETRHSEEDYKTHKDKAVEYNLKSLAVKRDFLKLNKPKLEHLLRFHAF